MIPAFGPDGHLPAGVWPSTLIEVEKKYSYNVFRKELFKKLLFLIQDLKIIQCNRIYIDGSFITTKLKPNDIDVCWEEGTGSNYTLEELWFPALFDPAIFKMIYGLDVFPARYMESNSRLLFIDFFQRIKYTDIPKGIIQLDI